MGSRRRSRKKGMAEDLIEQPWQLSATLAVTVFFFVRWIAPSVVPNSLRVGLTPLFGTMSWIALAAFSFLAALAFVRAKVQAASQKPKARQTPDAFQAELSTSKSKDISGAASTPQLVQARNDPEALPTAWSVENLRTLEWKRFELLCARYYQEAGFHTETIACGADGGIDVKLFKGDLCKPLAIVQCKAWTKRPVGVKEIRELLGVMAHEKISRGVFIATSGYTQDATAFGTANPIQLLDGNGFVQKLTELAPEKRRTLVEFAFAGDYRTPTCPSCGIKLVVREGKHGRFWGCTHYPKCRYKLAVQA